MNDGFFVRRLPSGLTCYVMQKRGYASSQAALSVRYGAADLVFRMCNGDWMHTPQGTAHFMEHMLFEGDASDVNIISRFAQQGASVNAYTNFVNTSFYCTTSERFDENLALLFRFVLSPHFNAARMDTERAVITREIEMYRDDPSWRRYSNLHRALFHHSPVRYDIAGTAESVTGININLLRTCYDTFYSPGNMSLVCVGDLDAERVFASAARYVEDSNSACSIERDYGNEPLHAASTYVEDHMPVSIPLFLKGYKAVFEPMPGARMGKIIAASQLLADIIAGESSPLYSRMYDAGFVDNDFSVSYIGSTFFGTSLFAGSSHEPARVADAIANEIERMKRDGIPRERFEIIKRKHMGRYLRGMNELEAIVTAQTDLHSKGLDIRSMLDAFESVAPTDVEECLHTYLRDENSALSVVWPVIFHS